jgi:hypothetical protein
LSDRDLQQIGTLIKAGDKAQARRRLIAVLKEDRDNEKAWVYMALCAANREELVASIRHALRVNPQSAPALKLATQHQVSIEARRKPNVVEEVAIDPYPTEDPHPTELLPPKRAKVDVKSEFRMPDWAEQEFKEDTLTIRGKSRKKSRGRGRALALGSLGLVLIIAVIAAGIIFFTGGNDTVSANAQTATSISATNADIYNIQVQTATSVWLTLNPPTPTRPPRGTTQ